MRAEELEKYAVEKYGKDWEEAATKLGQEITLDKNNAISYEQIIDAPGKTKDQLYVLLNYWFTSTFNDANSVIKLNDKELGTIIGQGYIENIAQHRGGSALYKVSLRPVIKCDIKDDKIRVTYTVPYYCALVDISKGWITAFGSNNSRNSESTENWTIDTCYPFAKKKDSHKKTSCKALVMAHAYSNVVMDKIEECIKNGLTGNESKDW